MKQWQRRFEQLLASSDAPPMLTRDLLDRYARSARDGQSLPASTLSWWIKNSVNNCSLIFVHRGLYLNRFRSSPGTLADTVPVLHKDAVVSLNTVLGDVGVLNNPSTAVTAVVPLDAGSPLPHLGRKLTKAGKLHFFGMPRNILQAGKPNDRLDTARQFDHARATPEKALIDWLYLAQSPRSRRTEPSRGDIDLELLKLPRLRRLAAAAGLNDEFFEWVESPGHRT